MQNLPSNLGGIRALTDTKEWREQVLDFLHRKTGEPQKQLLLGPGMDSGKAVE